MRRGDSLFSANEMAEMKNCNKCILFEGRKQRDLYMWIAGKNYTFIKLEGRKKVEGGTGIGRVELIFGVLHRKKLPNFW